MQGLAVVPLFAGYDLEAGQGRIFSYDVTGGRYEETAFHSVGSGSMFARGALKKLYRDDLDVEGCITAVVAGALRRRRRRLRHRRTRPDPADLPGGPGDHRRGRPPGARRRRRRDRRPGDRRPDASGPTGPTPHADRRAVPTHEHAVLRLARAADEGPGRLRPQGHRPRPVGRRRRSTPTASCSPRENPSQALHKVSEIYDRIAFAAVGRYNEFENLRIAGVRLADMRGYSYDRRDVTGRGLANAYAQTLGTIFSSGGEKPYEVELVRRRGRRRGRRRPDLPAHLRRPGRRRARLRRHGRRGRRRRRLPRGALRRGRLARRGRRAWPWRRSGTPPTSAASSRTG